MRIAKSVVPALCATALIAAPTIADAHGGKHGRGGHGHGGGATTLALNPDTAAALKAAGIEVTPLRPARAGSDGIAFPVVGTWLKADPLSGQIAHSGGLKLKSASATVKLKNFVINLDDAPDLTAKVGGARASILDLDLSAATVERKGRKLKASGVKANLSATGAAALNQAFGTDLPAGLPIGTATVEAKVKMRSGGGKHHR